jgi:uncharacterized protein YaeQ
MQWSTNNKGHPMSHKDTVFKVDLQIADLDRHYYHGHTLTLARHPMESIERLMVRLLTFSLFASENLHFCKGVCEHGEPALSVQQYNGDIDLWVELGQPEDKRLRKACQQAEQVIVVTYDGEAADLWWRQNHNKLIRLPNLCVINFQHDAVSKLSLLCQRSMRLQVTIEDCQVMVSDGKQCVTITPEGFFLAEA